MKIVALNIVLVASLLQASASYSASRNLSQPLKVEPTDSVLTIVGTNDIHGGFATSPPERNRPVLGGAHWFLGYLRAIKAAGDRAWGSRHSMVLLDGGDAAQGTLLSNRSEGKLASEIMSTLGYTAAVPGNHAYDFGPIGSDIDQCPPRAAGCNPLATLEAFSRSSNFPLVASNLHPANDPTGSPSFVKPFVVIARGELKIAILGLENPGTPSSTYSENVQSVRFTDGKVEIVGIVERLLKNREADLFLLAAHDGDAPNTQAALTEWIRTLPKRSDGRPLLDAIVGGHTHRINDAEVNGIPFIQSASGGTHFGLIQLVLAKDASTGRFQVKPGQSRQQAGIPIAPGTKMFAGEPVIPDADLQRKIQTESAAAERVAQQPIGETKGPFTSEGGRISDSLIGNLVADLMRRSAHTDVAAIGSGDIRDGWDRALRPASFGDLFQVFPKNLVLVAARVPVAALVENLKRSVESCSRRGALQISGMQVFFRRNCKSPVGGIDPQSTLLKVTLDSGAVIYPPSSGSPEQISVATTDFVLTGGGGYRAFRDLYWAGYGTDAMRVVGPLREQLAGGLRAISPVDPAQFGLGRYVNCLEANFASSPGCRSQK